MPEHYETLEADEADEVDVEESASRPFRVPFRKRRPPAVVVEPAVLGRYRGTRVRSVNITNGNTSRYDFGPLPVGSEVAAVSVGEGTDNGAEDSLLFRAYLNTQRPASQAEMRNGRSLVSGDDGDQMNLNTSGGTVVVPLGAVVEPNESWLTVEIQNDVGIDDFVSWLSVLFC